MASRDPRGTVLVVDDSPDLADLHATFLGDRYEVRTAYGGDAALDAIDRTVDVVLLDREMPSRSGPDVLAALDRRQYDPRIAMVTGVSPDFDILELAIDDYLQKPVGPAAVRGTVDRLLSIRSERQRKLAALRSKRDLLTREKDDAELQASPAYRRLLADIEILERTPSAAEASGPSLAN